MLDAPYRFSTYGESIAIDLAGWLVYMLAYIFEFPLCAYPFKPLQFEPILSSNCSNLDSSNYRNPSFCLCVLNSRQPLQTVILLGFPHMQNVAVGQTEAYMEQFKGLKKPEVIIICLNYLESISYL